MTISSTVPLLRAAPLLKHMPIRTRTERRVQRLLHEQLAPTVPMPRPTLWSASWETLHSLCSLIRRSRRPVTMAEFGSGASTVWFALAARAAGGGHIHSVDHEQKFRRATQDLLRQHGVADYATVHHAPLRPCALNDRQPWYDSDVVAGHPSGINLVFVDGPVASIGRRVRYPALPSIADKLADTCTVVLDDTHRSKEQRIWRDWIAELSADFSVSVQPPLSRSTAMILRRR